MSAVKLTPGKIYSGGKVTDTSEAQLERMGSFYQEAVLEVQKDRAKKKKEEAQSPISTHPQKFTATHTVVLRDGKEYEAKLLGEDSEKISIRLPSGQVMQILKKNLQFMQPIN